MGIRIWEANTGKQEVCLRVHLAEELHEWNAASATDRDGFISFEHLFVGLIECFLDALIELPGVEPIIPVEL